MNTIWLQYGYGWVKVGLPYVYHRVTDVLPQIEVQVLLQRHNSNDNSNDSCITAEMTAYMVFVMIATMMQ